MKLKSIWAVVDPEIPWMEWWQELATHFKWPENAVIEKFGAQEISWSRVLDSALSFTLFNQPKVIVVLDSDKALKGEKDPQRLIEAFERSPHRVVFHSTNEPPTQIKMQSWTASSRKIEDVHDEKAGFRWIDTIHAENLSSGLASLDSALHSGQHPLALLQMLTRDFRIGRLIHHAQDARFKESEIASSLKVPPFVIQKWLKRTRLPNSGWAMIFDRLLQADLEFKSGAEGIWVLRKLTFDLVQMMSVSHPQKFLLKRTKKPSTAPLLWTALPSFA